MALRQPIFGRCAPCLRFDPVKICDLVEALFRDRCHVVMGQIKELATTARQGFALQKPERGHAPSNTPVEWVRYPANQARGYIQHSRLLPDRHLQSMLPRGHMQDALKALQRSYQIGPVHR
jgi:hypothetical protein